jgi:hypothetical protein
MAATIVNCRLFEDVGTSECVSSDGLITACSSASLAVDHFSPASHSPTIMIDLTGSEKTIAAFVERAIADDPRVSQ